MTTKINAKHKLLDELEASVSQDSKKSKTDKSSKKLSGKNFDKNQKLPLKLVQQKKINNIISESC